MREMNCDAYETIFEGFFLMSREKEDGLI